MARLADGEYTLTLTASDSSAQAGVTSVTFTIGGPSFVYLPLILRN